MVLADKIVKIAWKESEEWNRSEDQAKKEEDQDGRGWMQGRSYL